jgi:hypothetical protein
MISAASTIVGYNIAEPSVSDEAQTDFRINGVGIVKGRLVAEGEPTTWSFGTPDEKRQLVAIFCFSENFEVRSATRQSNDSDLQRHSEAAALRKFTRT